MLIQGTLYQRSLALFICLIGLVIEAGAFDGRGTGSGPSEQPADWDSELRLPEAVDRNPDPRVVEVDIEATLATVEIAPGVAVEAWTYNGLLPGPLIRVRQGDRLIVHFTNRLPEPTTIHWHGLRISVKMDGVPGHSQVEVAPGAAFTYDFVVPDAGLYWYHPHVDSAAQVGFGLYAPLLVVDPQEHVGVDDELVLVLSDVAMTEEGRLEPPDSGGSAGMVFGREGQYVLVNGRVRPTLTARSGVPQRWRILNAAKSRYFNLDADGAAFTKIGGDGGLQEHPVESQRLVMAAGERADVIIAPRGAPGDELVLMSMHFNRGYGSVEYREQPELFAIRFSDDPELPGRPLPDVRGTIEEIPTASATQIDVNLTLAENADGSFIYGINGVPFAEHQTLEAMPGETQVWTITNSTDWSHPFHLHGFRFLVLDDRGEPLHPLAWKDTVDVPLRQTVRFVVRFDDRPGTWMYHCHILDHADGGMMGVLQVGAGDAHQEAGPVHPH